MLLRLIVLGLAIAAALLLLSAGPGTRFGFWHFSTGFQVLRWALYLGLTATFGALIALAIPRVRRRWAPALVLALVLGAGSVFVPLYFQSRARLVPPINDISTDLQTQYAEQQKEGYPDIQPLRLEIPPPMAYSRALAAAEAMGWEVVTRDRAAARIQAVATTFWFGFQDDVTVQVTPEGQGSRVDVRSKSRVGRSDAGANAQRIRDYLKRLK